MWWFLVKTVVSWSLVTSSSNSALIISFEIIFLHLYSLKLTSQGELHYLWSADLSKSFYQLIMSKVIFSQYFFQKTLFDGKVWGYPSSLISWFITVKLTKIFGSKSLYERYRRLMQIYVCINIKCKIRIYIFAICIQYIYIIYTYIYNMYIYVYICIYVYMYVHVYIIISLYI